MAEELLECQATWMVCVEQDRGPVVLDQMKDAQQRHQSVLNMDTVNAPLTSQVDQSVDPALVTKQKMEALAVGEVAAMEEPLDVDRLLVEEILVVAVEGVAGERKELLLRSLYKGIS